MMDPDAIFAPETAILIAAGMLAATCFILAALIFFRRRR